MKENKKTIQILAVVTLLIAVVCISVGFALLSQQLTITGQAKIIPANWSVHFVTLDNSGATPVGGWHFDNDGTSAFEGSDAPVGYTWPTGMSAPSAPTLTESIFSGYNCILTRPGDKCIYTFDVTNDGDIDAKISDISPSTGLLSPLTFTGTGDNASDDVDAVENDVTYTLSWTDGTVTTLGSAKGYSSNAIAINQELAVGDTATVQIEISYNSRDGQELPTAPVTISGDPVVITYQQDN